MKLFGRDLSHEVAIVAEIGVNHEGDPRAAERMIRLAAEAGADAVKLQTYTPERFVSTDTPERLDRVRRFALSIEDTRQLAEVAREVGVHFFSTAVTEDVVSDIAPLGEAVKIASGDLDFAPVIKAAVRSGRTVILSTGLGTLREVDTAVKLVRRMLPQGVALKDRLVLMHCVSAYPAPLEQANVRSVPVMIDRYGVSVGWSNHVMGPEACLAAVALGASVLEVHFTDQREGKVFHDHALSMEPQELADLVATAPRIKASLGRFNKAPQPAEIPLKGVIRKGVVVSRDLPAGRRLQRSDLMYARPATGYPAHTLPDLVGRRLIAPIQRGQSLKPEHLSATPVPELVKTPAPLELPAKG